MPTFLESFFGSLSAQCDGPASSEHDLQLATAALLIEMMRADNAVGADEIDAVRHALQHEFALDEAELDALIEHATAEARDAPGYFAFTRRINEALPLARKLRLMEYLWRVALADGHLAAHENHLMRKLADLIHIGHGDYHAAKARARSYLEAKGQTV